MTTQAPLAAEPRVARWREDTPGCAHRIHLNNAGASLMPRPVLEAVQSHLTLESEIGGYEAEAAAVPARDQAYAAVAKLIGARPRNIAVVENATVAYAQALSAFDFERGDVLLTTRNDYASNQIMFLSLARRRGLEVVRAADQPAGGADPDSVRDLIARRRPKLVAVTWVPTNSGLVQPVEAIGEICAAAGVPYLVDACQTVGQLPIDIARLRCDFLSATARKFLRGPRGVGFLFVSDAALARDAAPLLPDMRGADWIAPDQYRLSEDASRFENWEYAVALVLGLGASARYALDAGIADTGRRAASLAAHARERLAAVPRVRVLDRGPTLCAIVTAEIAGMDAGVAVKRLRASGINTSAARRIAAQIDMAEKRAESAVRLSPHYYNTLEEVNSAVDAIAAIAAGR